MFALGVDGENKAEMKEHIQSHQSAQLHAYFLGGPTQSVLTMVDNEWKAVQTKKFSWYTPGVYRKQMIILSFPSVVV